MQNLPQKIVILFMLLCTTLSYSQESLESVVAREQSLKEDFGYTWKGIANFYASPFKWKKKQFLQTGLVLGSYAALTFIDEPVNPFFKKLQPKVPTPIREFGDWFGGPINAVVFSGGLFTYGYIAKKPKIKKTGILLMSSIAAAGFLQTTIKTMVGRARPSAEVGARAYKPFTPLAKYHSFPSGHSVVATVFAHSIARQVDNPWAKAGIYAVGAITPVSRLWDGAHWFSDVALGTFIGFITVDSIDKYLTKIYEGEQVKKELTNVWKLDGGLMNFKISYTFN
ncbi:phosphatase PAP2 family protein [Wenyingzhuangia aestuarii]|uniref:phosphatase PAP2 family protein n=1 Tax=Wenyingzhuangia aestuarii TaxID=1647582 RepID=UPI00143934D9|nr:phosphatase PAP2 family protein [Wenyingzhuangia aestuarii]NJB83071.1 membrane-associated phospholipid phosphatase [Wenyingzhuangia aestuarii]